VYLSSRLTVRFGIAILEVVSNKVPTLVSNAITPRRIIHFLLAGS